MMSIIEIISLYYIERNNIIFNIFSSLYEKNIVEKNWEKPRRNLEHLRSIFFKSD
jgi:hypothetical protein